MSGLGDPRVLPDTKTMMRQRTKTILLLATAVLGATYAQPPAKDAPQYTKDGELLLPKDYRNWSFLSSSISMSYPEEGPGGHAMFGNLFVQPAAREQFEKTGTWPDKTVLLMELRGVGGRGGDAFLNKDAQFQTDLHGYEAHVKDSARGGWAFYGIRSDATSGKAVEKTAKCFSCHENHGAVDTTFVQYYPPLIEAAKQHGTYKDTNHQASRAR